MNWVFINTGHRPGAYNMALDEGLARAVQEGSGRPVLRVYGWNPPAISVGFNQPVEDFDPGLLSRAGIDLVRRPTGGRAILHINELTYSVATQCGEDGPRALYRFLNEGILQGLRSLGIRAELATRDDDFRTLYRDPASIPCFSTSARCEIVSGGRKLVGSAQRRFGRAILQHGSLLLGPEHRSIVDFLAARVREARPALTDALTARTVDAGTLLGRTVSFEEAASAVKKGFEEACGITFEVSEEVLQ
jgi:lipoate-protein ligase A